MALRADNQDDQIYRTSIHSLTAYSEMMWVQIATDMNRLTIFTYRNDIPDDSQWIVFGLDPADGTTLAFETQTSVFYGGTSLSVGTWYHVALVKDGSNFVIYLNGTVDVSQSDSASTNLITTHYLFGFHNGGASFDFGFNGRMSAYKVYAAALTQSEVRQEMFSGMPCRTANLYCWLPMCDGSLAANYNDYSGNGRHFTLWTGGALTIEGNPPIPWRQGRSRVFRVASAATGFGSLLANRRNRLVAA